MNKAKEQANELLRFIDQSPTAFHATRSVTTRLDQAGFTRLDERERWSLEPSGRYYLTRNDSSVVAFVTGSAPAHEAGFVMIGAHTDSPCLKVKPQPNLARAGYRQLGVEIYGGMILSTWLDRDLGLAGRVIVEAEDKTLVSYLIHIDRPILRVPTLAIHLNREVNDQGMKVNKQTHMQPVLGLGTEQNTEADLRNVLRAQIEAEHGVRVTSKQIVDFDVCAIDTQPSALGGLAEEFIFAPRLDNLASCHAGLQALLRSLDTHAEVAATRLVSFWDNEECGSRSIQGAQGPLLRQTIERITAIQASDDLQAPHQATARSLLVSADMAHAVHPNYIDKHEPAHRPVLGAGPVIKKNANQSYASDGLSSAMFTQACQAAGFEPQQFVVRSDLPSGSTIGPITAAVTGVKTVDVGNPMISMHSIREMAATNDHEKMIAALTNILTSALA